MIWRRGSGGQKGQSVVEVALFLPVLLLLIVVGIDLGRAFMTQITLNNSVRVGANFAAQHPDAWGSNPDAVAQSRYEALITNEWAGMDCEPPSPIPAPSFPEGKNAGSPARLDITCQFEPVTPLLSNVVPSVAVRAIVSFPIRAGEIGGGGTGQGMCTVPTFVGTGSAGAQATWSGAGFFTTVTLDPVPPPDYDIERQSVTAGASHWCDSTSITLEADTCTVPNVVGLDSALVQEEWEAAGFTSAVLFHPSTEEEDYEVGRQFPPAMTDGEPTILVCSSGQLFVESAEMPPCTVPNFIGTSTENAQATWLAAGFVTTVTFDPPGPLHYTISGQNQPAGVDLSCATTAIQLTGTPMCTVPQLIGLRPNQAQTAWTGAGFNPQNLIWSPLPQGQAPIRSQSPGQGTVGPCATQTVTVSQN